MSLKAYRFIKNYYIHHQHGFTLIEVLVALVILSIGMLGMSRIAVSTVSVQTANERLAKASVLLQDSMERIKQTGYSYGGSTTNTVTDNYGSISGYNTYQRQTQVTVNTPAANMKTVTVTIFWQNGRQALSTTTILAE